MSSEKFAECKVIWEGSNPNGNERFRIVDRACGLKHGNPQATLTDKGPRYVAEQRKGHDSLGVSRWGHVEVGSRYAFAKAMMTAYLVTLIEDDGL